MIETTGEVSGIKSTLGQKAAILDNPRSFKTGNFLAFTETLTALCCLCREAKTGIEPY